MAATIAEEIAELTKPSLQIGHDVLSPTRAARLHEALQRHIDHGTTPGLVALIHRRGHEHLVELGTMAFDSTVPMRRDTIFRLASMTKPITAVGAMILVEECKIRLDDPVDEWLPELRWFALNVALLQSWSPILGHACDHASAMIQSGFR